jgi:branched-chain amino acid transport system permease protein
MDVLVSTITLAATYGLIGVGISLTWAGLGFLNLAHGVTFAAAGYCAWWAAENISSNVVVVLIAGLFSGAIAGAIVCTTVFLPLDGRINWTTRSMIASLALAIIGLNVFLLVFGPRDKPLPALFGSSVFSLGGYNITADKSGSILVSLAVMVIVVVALAATRMGLGVRAMTQSTEGAALVGIGRTQAAFAILMVSGALAGLAAVLLAQVFYVSPNAGFVPLIKGLIVALLGGLGSVPGTVIAALLVGATEALTARYLDQSYVLLTLFGLIAIVLLVRPRGVAGILETTRV